MLQAEVSMFADLESWVACYHRQNVTVALTLQNSILLNCSSCSVFVVSTVGGNDSITSAAHWLWIGLCHFEKEQFYTCLAFEHFAKDKPHKQQ